MTTRAGSRAELASAELAREAHIAEAHALLELAKRRLVQAENLEPGDVVAELANLVTFVQWQCETLDSKAIGAAYRLLEKARREARRETVATP